MSSTKLETINFTAFQPVSDAHGISAAVIIPASFCTIATSGHVGTDAAGKLGGSLEEQMQNAFKVTGTSIRGPSCASQLMQVEL